MAGRAFPQQYGLALVRNTDRSRRVIDCRQAFSTHRHGGLPDLLGIMLYPAVRGKDLWELSLRARTHFASAVENDGTGTRRSLVDRE